MSRAPHRPATSHEMELYFWVKVFETRVYILSRRRDAWQLIAQAVGWESDNSLKTALKRFRQRCSDEETARLNQFDALRVHIDDSIVSADESMLKRTLDQNIERRLAWLKQCRRIVQKYKED